MNVFKENKKDDYDWNKIFPVIIGKEGIDDYFLLYNTGEKIPWPTDEDRRKWNEEFPITIESMKFRIKYNEQKYGIEEAKSHFPTEEDIRNWEKKNNILLNQR